MAGNNTIELLIRLMAENGQLKAVLGASKKEISALGPAGAQAGQQITAGTTAAAGGVAKLTQQLQTAQRLIVAFGTLAIGGQSIVGLVRLADEYTNLNARLRLATDGQDAFNTASAELFDIAQRTRQALGDTVELYARLARSTKDLDSVAPRDLLAVTEAINQAIAVSGGNAESANAAIFQLGQGLSSGALRGEELNSVMEQTPRLAQAIADGLGVGLGQLRQMGAEGKLTSEAIIGALMNQSSTLKAEFAQMPTTVGGAITQIKNAWGRYISTANDATGATSTLAGALSGIAGNLEQIADTTIRVGGIVATVYAVRLVQAVRLWTLEQAAAYAAQQAATAASVADAAAKVRQTAAVKAHAAILVAEAEAAVASASGMARLAVAQNVLIPARAKLATATAAHTAALQAEAVAARAGAARMLTLSTAINALGAAFVGYQIGSWLRDQFAIVERVSARVVGGAHIMLVELGAFFEGVALRAKIAWREITGRDAVDLRRQLVDLRTETKKNVEEIASEYQALVEAATERNEGIERENRKLTREEIQHRQRVRTAAAGLTSDLKAEIEKQIEAREEANDRLRRIRDDREKIEDEFAQLVERVQRGPQREKEPSFLDAYIDLGRVRQAAVEAQKLVDAGDFAGASRQADRTLERAREVGEVITDLVDSGRGGSGATFLAKQLQGIASALQSVREQAAEQDVADQEAVLERLIGQVKALEDASKALQIDFDEDQAVDNLETIKARLQALADQKPVVIKVEFETTDTSAAADLIKNATVVTPQNRAFGGPITGYSPTPTADNIPVNATAGEYMQSVAAVRHAGMPFMHALNARLIPRAAIDELMRRMNGQRLAAGGPVLPAIPAVPQATQAPSTDTVMLLDLNGRRYRARADVGTAQELERALRLERLKS